MRRRRFPTGILRVWMLATIVLAGAMAWADLVQTSHRRLDGGRADFGGGTHSFGVPDFGAITYDYSPVCRFAFLGFFCSDLRATGRVRGTLYWDSLFGSGCARLTVRFQDSNRNTLSLQQVNHCGPGGNANSAANQAPVDLSFASPFLSFIALSVNEVQGGTLLSGASTSVQAPMERSYPLRIESGTADFGGCCHFAGTPVSDGEVNFFRSFFPDRSTFSGSVRGTLFWDSLFTPGCARITNEFLDSRGVGGGLTEDICGPGGNANSSANKRAISHNGSGWRFRVSVGSVSGGNFVGVTSRSFEFAGAVGTFEVDPAEAAVAAGELLDYVLVWTVPEPLDWHDLRWVQVRIADGTETVLRLLWDEASNTVSVFNEAASRFGRGFAPGSPVRLQTPHATVHLADTGVGAVNGVLGAGPTSPSVALRLALSFKPPAAGRAFRVQVAAADHAGREDPFVDAGTLTVLPAAR